MSTTFEKLTENREKPKVGKLSISEEAIRKSPFIIKKTEEAKRMLREHPFPVELLRSK